MAKETIKTVSLEKTLNVNGSDVSLDGEFQPYFSDRNLCVTALGPNSLESMGTVNTVAIPATIQSVARPQRHQVQNAFILNGTVGAVKDGALYDLTDKYLVTAPKSFETLTVRAWMEKLGVKENYVIRDGLHQFELD